MLPNFLCLAVDYLLSRQPQRLLLRASTSDLGVTLAKQSLMLCKL